MLTVSGRQLKAGPENVHASHSAEAEVSSNALYFKGTFQDQTSALEPLLVNYLQTLVNIPIRNRYKQLHILKVQR